MVLGVTHAVWHTISCVDRFARSGQLLFLKQADDETAQRGCDHLGWLAESTECSEGASCFDFPSVWRIFASILPLRSSLYSRFRFLVKDGQRKERKVETGLGSMW